MLFELENVSYRYSDGTPALHDVDLKVEQGESIALLGANGSGKSTLLRLLAGLYFASSGQVRFKGQALSEAALKAPEFRQEFRQAAGFVFQNAEAQLFNATVFEEVAFGPRQMGMEGDLVARVDETLAFLGISHLADRAPFRLSGGEKRKVAIASVLSMNPQVLMFDEPFLGLDPRGQTWLVETIQQLRSAGKTILIATHTLDLAASVTDTAIVLSETHELIARGTTAAVATNQSLLVEANLIEARPAGVAI